MSYPGCASFLKQSQVMISTELPVSIRIHRTTALAIFISTTRGLLWGDANRGASFPPNTMAGATMHDPCSTVRTCRTLLSWLSTPPELCPPQSRPLWWPRPPWSNPHQAAAEEHVLVFVKGAVAPFSKTDQFIPCLPTHEGLLSILDIRLWCARFAHGIHNTSARFEGAPS